MASAPLSTHGVDGTNGAEHQDVRTQEYIFSRILEALNREATRASDTDGNPSRYSSVHVLQIKWEHDDLGVAPEFDALATVLENDFGFCVEKFAIPAEKSLQRLSLTMLEWMKSCDHDDGLLIVYYAGHGRISDSGRSAVWHNRFYRDDMYSELRWTGCEEIILEAASDKLFIFDCCYAASAASTGFRGVSETICATGFESIAPRPGPHSFTTALIFALRQMARQPRPFSVSILYAAILAYLKELDPTQIAPDGFRIADAHDHTVALPGLRRPEYRRTPIHFVRTHHHQSPDIQLFPLAQSKGFEVIHEKGYSEEKGERYRAFTLRVRPAGNLTEADAEASRRWLRNIPMLTENISVEAALTAHAGWRGVLDKELLREYDSSHSTHDIPSRIMKLNERMLRIYEKSEEETTNIRIISVVTLIFLPGTFLASISSPGVIDWEPRLDRPWLESRQNPEILLFIVIYLSSFTCTVLAWMSIFYFWRWRYPRKMGFAHKHPIYKIA